MKAKEIRDLSPQEQQQKLIDLKEDLFQIENPTKLKKTKADIARIKTIIKETENQTQE